MRTLVEQIDSRIKKLEDMRHCAECMEGCPWTTFVSDTKMVVQLRDVSELSKARSWLRERLGKWTDSVYVWCCFNRAFASWEAEGGSVAIWLEKPINQFPKELLRDGCRFERCETTEYQIVCEMEP